MKLLQLSFVNRTSLAAIVGVGIFSCLAAFPAELHPGQPIPNEFAEPRTVHAARPRSARLEAPGTTSDPASEGLGRAAPQPPRYDYHPVSRHQDERGLAERLRSHRVQLAGDGMLRGQLSVIDPNSGQSIPISGIVIGLVKERNVYRRVQPLATGKFELPRVSTGIYSFVAAGDDGFIAMGVHVEVREETARETQQGALSTVLVSARQAETKLDIDGLAVPPSNFNILKTLVRFYLRDDFLSGRSAISPQSDAADASPAGLPERLEERRLPLDSTNRQHGVRLSADGRLRGRVRRDHPETGQPVRVRGVTVFALQDDQIVSQAAIDASGDFHISGLQPGTYSLAALGTRGFAAFSFRLLPPREQELGADQIPVALVPAPAVREEAPLDDRQLDVMLIDPGDIPAVLALADQYLPGGLDPMSERATGTEFDTTASTPAAPGSGGGGGGSGGSGGGSGFAGMFLGAAAGIAATAATSDEKPLASPFRPR